MEDSTLFYVKDDSLYYTKDSNNIHNLHNFRYNYFYLKDGYSVFHPNLCPFKKPKRIPTIGHRIVIDPTYQITKPQIDSIFKTVNRILLSIDVGVQVRIDTIIETDRIFDFNMNRSKKNKTIKYLDSISPGLENSNLIIFSKNVITLDNVSTKYNPQDAVGKAIKNGKNPIILIYEPTAIFNPFRITHEILHRTTGNFVPHCEKCFITSKTCKEKCNLCRTDHLLMGEISNCNIYIYANDMLGFSQYLDLESAKNKIIWPRNAEDICCENIFQYGIHEIFKLFDEMDVRHILDNKDNVSIHFTKHNPSTSVSDHLLNDIINISKKEVINRTKYYEVKTIEAKFFNIDPTTEYLDNRYNHDQEILERNAKIVLNHYMINKKDEIALRKAELQEILKEYFCEHLQNHPSVSLTKKYLELFPKEIIVKVKYIKNGVTKYKFAEFNSSPILLPNGVSIKFNKSDFIRYKGEIAMENLKYYLSKNLDTISFQNSIIIPKIITYTNSNTQPTQCPVNERKYFFNLNEKNFFKIVIVNQEDKPATKTTDGVYWFDKQPKSITILYASQIESKSQVIKSILSSHFTNPSSCSYNYNIPIILN